MTERVAMQSSGFIERYLFYSSCPIATGVKWKEKLCWHHYMQKKWKVCYISVKRSMSWGIYRWCQSITLITDTVHSIYILVNLLDDCYYPFSSLSHLLYLVMPELTYLILLLTTILNAQSGKSLTCCIKSCLVSSFGRVHCTTSCSDF